jgi:hypothetical protein
MSQHLNKDDYNIIHTNIIMGKGKGANGSQKQPKPPKPTKKYLKMCEETFSLAAPCTQQNECVIKPSIVESKDRKKDSNFKMIKGQFGEEIPLTYPPQKKHKVDWLKGHCSIQINGASGSGKSVLLCKIIPLINNLDTIIIFSLVDNPPLYNQIEKYCEANDIKYYLSIDDPVEGAKLMEKVIEEKDPQKEGLIVLDDFSQYSRSRDNPYARLSTMANSLLRNYGFHNIVLTQSPNNVPTLQSCNASTKILFKIADKYGLIRAKGDYEQATGRQDFKMIYNCIKDNPHSYMMTSQGKVYVYLHNDGKNSIFKEVPCLLDRLQAESNDGEQ